MAEVKLIFLIYNYIIANNCMKVLELCLRRSLPNPAWNFPLVIMTNFFNPTTGIQSNYFSTVELVQVLEYLVLRWAELQNVMYLGKLTRILRFSPEMFKHWESLIDTFKLKIIVQHNEHM